MISAFDVNYTITILRPFFLSFFFFFFKFRHHQQRAHGIDGEMDDVLDSGQESGEQKRQINTVR